MEPLLRTFSLGFLLRSVFAGIFFPISYYIALNGDGNLKGIIETDIIQKAIPVALLAGVFSYGFHRALLYPIIEWMLNANRVKRFRERCPLISTNTREWLVGRWCRSSGAWEKEKDIARHVTVWADLTHLQYASVVSIAFGSITGCQLAKSCHAPYPPLIWLGVFLALGGFISDWRLHSVEDGLSNSDTKYCSFNWVTVLAAILFLGLAVLSLIYNPQVSVNHWVIPISFRVIIAPFGLGFGLLLLRESKLLKGE